ncbi:MAG: carboxylating nicotinate-nucleotide diphosphorylase [Candidatus Competibacteraceae bacterium]|nr:carboxylating nicotinate-nucleotide diphosphorylase [Candidatus Competibacteraceae bacterium]
MIGITSFITQALAEDIGNGDHTTLATIPSDAQGKAVLWIKQDCILAGIDIARQVFLHLQHDVSVHLLMLDGHSAKAGDKAMEVEGNIHTLLSGERLALNILQRMSGIATHTKRLSQLIQHTHTRLLDTRKTTPLFRTLEKEAVRIGGGYNHRMGLYDMVLIKDNHVDFSGGISSAINRVHDYFKQKNLQLPIEVEVRNLDELQQVIDNGKVNRILFDNFSPKMLKEGIRVVDKRYETEASGGINEQNIVTYAETGVDFISVGALTHHINSIDMSLKAHVSS